MQIPDAAALDRAATPVRFEIFSSTYRAIGKFEPLESANDFVIRLIEENKTTIDAVGNGSQRDAWLECRFGYPTGKEALVSDDSGVPRFRATYNVGVYIVRGASSPRGYIVRTAYPLNNYPGEDRR